MVGGQKTIGIVCVVFAYSSLWFVTKVVFEVQYRCEHEWYPSL